MSSKFGDDKVKSRAKLLLIIFSKNHPIDFLNVIKCTGPKTFLSFFLNFKNKLLITKIIYKFMFKTL